MDSNIQNNNKEFNKENKSNTNKNLKRGNNNVKSNSYNKTTNQGKSDFKPRFRQEGKENKSVPSQSFQNKIGMGNKQSGQSSEYNSYNNSDSFNYSGYLDENDDVIRKTKSRDWKKKQQKQKQKQSELQEFEGLDMNFTKIQRQMDWEERKGKHKKKNRKKGRHDNCDDFYSYDGFDDFGDYENDGWS